MSPAIDRANSHRDSTLRQTHLGNVVVQIQDAELGRRRDSKHGCVELKLGASARVRPDMVANRERIVQRRRAPLIDSAWPKRNRSGAETDSRHPGRRIGEGERRRNCPGRRCCVL